MSRYSGTMVIEFNDAENTEGRYKGNRHEIIDGVVLSVYEASAYGESRGRQNFPLANIKSYRWEGE